MNGNNFAMFHILKMIQVERDSINQRNCSLDVFSSSTLFSNNIQN